MRQLFAILIVSGLLFSCGPKVDSSGKPEGNEAKKNTPAAVEEKTVAKPTLSKIENKPVEWKDFSLGESQAATSGKQVIVYVFDPECSNCKEMEINTFGAPEVQKLLQSQFVPIKLNGRETQTIIAKGQEFKSKVFPGGGHFHELALALTKSTDSMDLPAVIFMDEQMNLIQHLTGTISPQRMENLLLYFGAKHWEKMTFQAFLDAKA